MADRVDEGGLGQIEGGAAGGARVPGAQDRHRAGAGAQEPHRRGAPSDRAASEAREAPALQNAVVGAQDPDGRGSDYGGAAGHDAQDRNDPRLVRMANQIATFFASQPAVEPAQAVAAHVNDYWPPRMRLRLLDLIAAGANGLRPEATAAAPLIRRSGQAPLAAAGVDPGTPPTREAVEGAPAAPAFAAEPEGSDG